MRTPSVTYGDSSPFGGAGAQWAPFCAGLRCHDRRFWTRPTGAQDPNREVRRGQTPTTFRVAQPRRKKARGGGRTRPQGDRPAAAAAGQENPSGLRPPGFWVVLPQFFEAHPRLACRRRKLDAAHSPLGTPTFVTAFCHRKGFLATGVQGGAETCLPLWGRCHRFSDDGGGSPS